MIKAGRWRAEVRLEVWRVHPPQRVVLWGQRPGQRAFGGSEDRLGRLLDGFREDMMRGLFSRIGELTRDHVHISSGYTVLSFQEIPRIGSVGRQVAEQLAGWEERLRAYSGARGWTPEAGDQA